MGNDKTETQIIVIIKTGWNNPGLLENLVRQSDFRKNCPLNGLFALGSRSHESSRHFYPQPHPEIY
jgi:hypothetical protein